MVQEKYLKEITKKLNQFSKKRDLKFFVFGSALKRGHSGDLDLGVMGKISDKDLMKLRENFVNSTLPYSVDVINFNKVSKQFKDNIFNNKILWIKH